MRRQLATLAMGTWVALAGLVVTAAPAAAHPTGDCVSTERRNVGGTGPAACGCGPLERRNVGGTGPAACSCWLPPGLGERRNVGGTGPADVTCPRWLNFGWQFPRFR